MQSNQFLDHLAEKGLLDEEVLSQLRTEVGDADVTPEAITKLLVDNGHLTQFQATKLVGDLKDRMRSAKSKSAAKPSGKTQNAKQPPGDPDLDLAPLSGELEVSIDDDEEEVVALEDASAPQQSPKSQSKSKSSSASKKEKTSSSRKKQKSKQSAPAATSDPGGKMTGSRRKQQWQGEPQDASLGDAGGLEPLGPVDALGTPTGATDPMSSSPPPAKPQRPTAPRERRNVWDSKKMIGGGLLLGLLLVGGIWLLISLLTGGAKEMFKEAEKAYENNSFSSASKIYTKYLKKYGKHEDASLARVRIRMCRLNQQRGTPGPALKVAKDIIPRIIEEPAFADNARVELEVLLPEIAFGFADKAVKSKDVAEKGRLLKLADEAVALITKSGALGTTSLNKNHVVTKMKAIDEARNTARRAINQDVTLRKAIAEMTKLTGLGKTLEALQKRKELLMIYPGLDRHPDLVKATLATTATEKALVTPLDRDVKAETSAQPGVKVDETVPSTLTGAPIDSARGHVGYVTATGRLFAIDVASGKLLWSRRIGDDARFQPQRASANIGADVIAADSRTNEVLRLEAKTGRVKWRAPIGEKFAQPVVLTDRVMVSSQSALRELDLETGNSTRQTSFPLPLTVPATYDRLARKYYQLGEHANLYVVDEKTMACDNVYFFGHDEGTVEVPPVSAVGFLLVCVNTSNDSSQLHVLQVKDGVDIQPAMEFQFEGKILVPPVLFGRKALVLTDRGAIHVYEVDPNMATPLTQVASVAATYSQSTLAYPLVENSRLWLGEQRFIKYLVLTNKGKLVREFVQDVGEYIAPIQLYGDVLLQVRRNNGSPGVHVAAKSADSQGAGSSWQLDLAVPTSLTIDPTNNQVRAITARSGLFAVADGNHVVTEKPGIPGLANGAFIHPLSTSQGATILSELRRNNQLLVYDPATDAGKLQQVALQGTVGEAAAPPVVYKNGVLVAFKSGMIGLFDWKTGAEVVLPFLPPLSGGQRVNWSRPVVIGEDFVVADDSNVMRRIAVVTEPRPHLGVRSKLDLKEPVLGNLSLTEALILGVTRGQSVDTVQSFGAEDLKPGEKVELKGRVIWGPESVNGLVFLATPSELHCFQGIKLKWSTPLPYGPLTGVPLVEGDDYILTSTSGTVWRIAGADGVESSKMELGQPVVGQGLSHDGRIWLPAYDGTILVVPMINPS